VSTLHLNVADVLCYQKEAVGDDGFSDSSPFDSIHLATAAEPAQLTMNVDTGE